MKSVLATPGKSPIEVWQSRQRVTWPDRGHYLQRAWRILLRTTSKTSKICWSYVESVPSGQPSLDCSGQWGFWGWKGHERTTSRTRPHTVVQRAIFMITLGAMRCCPLHKFLATRESLRTIRLSRACMKKTIGETKAPVMIFRVHDTWTISVALYLLT